MTNCVQRSIDEKWLPILRGEHKPEGVWDCPCCKQFYWDCRCEGCPIHQHTGLPACKGTPNAVFEILKDESDGAVGDYYYDVHAELTACAQWEIDFLREVERGLRE